MVGVLRKFDVPGMKETAPRCERDRSSELCHGLPDKDLLGMLGKCADTPDQGALGVQIVFHQAKAVRKVSTFLRVSLVYMEHT